MLPGPLVQLAMNPWWPAGIVAVVAAITCGLLWTRRQAETAKAVDLYRFLFENALEGIYENPIGGGFRTVNPAMVRILGYESAEALLKITPEQVEQIYVEPGRRADFLGLVSRSDIVTGFESEIRRPDGSTRWISENVRVVRDAAGRVAAIQGFVTDITDRRLAEAALRESEERYRGLYLANPYPMWIYDRETMRIISVNDAAIAVYGYTRAEFEQMTLPDLRPEREWEHMRSAVRSMQAGPNQMGVFTHRCKDGRELQVEVTTLVFTFHGREQVLSIGNDLTEREQTRAALHDSEFRYQLLFENSPLALVEFNYRSTIEWMDGLRASGVPDLATWADEHPQEFAAAMRRVPLIGINRAALRMLKASNSEEASAHQEFIMTDSSWTLRRQTMLAIWSGRNESEGNMTVRAIDGSELHVHSHWWVPTLNDRAHFERTPAIIVDLTATKAAERALAEERERLAVTLRAMAEGVITTDREGRVVFINQAAIKLTGWTASAASGRPITEICVMRHARTDVPVPTPVAAAIGGGGVIDLPPQTQVLRRVGGRSLVEGCCAPMLDATGRGTGAVLVLRDVTERSRMESELERASKLESVGILAGGIAHDFNNILAVVMGNLTLAQLDPSTENTPVAKWLQEAERATLRARDLTQQLLTFAKGGDPVRTAVRLPEVVREATEFSLHGSAVRAEFSTGANLWAADVDRSQIGQVVQNLVINAMQAMKNGGIIRVSLRNVDLAADGPVPLPAGRYLELSIADTGAGISPEHLARIFEPYFTTKEQGSGLGLATVYSIIRKHQGHVAVESEVGKGTTFRIWLPAAKESPPAPPVGKSAMEPMTGKVLFMDDEDPIRTMVDVLLSRLGLQVTTVPDGSDLLREYQAARAAGQPYDLVIMDLTVPGGMGGKEAMQELRKIEPEVRAIVSSGYSGDPVLANFRAHGFCGIVPKPYRLSDLANAVRNALKK
ncbi:MAG TPA: PAS domain S-box protein [Opitutaceae bacterium]|nr:PAS domain S-box protein [Opitutaceae bacterium]HND60386.1 PAS domain S-box protein [Opitutaceae bacterium]